AWLGYGSGHHAPGLAKPEFATRAMHHLLLAHGLALAPLAANDPQAQRGIVANVSIGSTQGDSPADQQAAHLLEVQHNHWVLQPLLAGGYPQDLFKLWPGTEPPVRDGDLETIRQPLDFLGINYYFRTTVRSDGAHGFVEVQRPGVERTQMGWEVYPQGLEDVL